MKFRLQRTFSVQVTNTRVIDYPSGVYDVPKDMPKQHADRAAQVRAGRYILEKVAPENKIVVPAEDKTGVGGKAKRRRRAGTKPDA